MLIGQLGADAASRWARTSASARAPGHAGVPGGAPRVRDPRGAAGRGGGRDGRPRATSAGSSRPATCARPPSSSAGPFMLEGEVVHGREARPHARDPTANIVPDDSLVAPGNGVYAAWAHGYPAAVNVGVRPTFETGRGPPDRGLPDRLRRRPLRRDPADRLRRAHARREALRVGGDPGRADAARRRAGPRDLRRNRY